MNKNTFTSENFLEWKNIQYPKDLLEKFQVKNIPEFVEKILSEEIIKFSWDLWYDFKKELTEDFIKKQKEIFIDNLIDVWEVFEFDIEFMKLCVNKEYKEILIEDNFDELFISIINQQLDEFIEPINSNYKNKKSVKKDDFIENGNKIALINTLFLDNNNDVNSWTNFKQISKIKKIDIEKLKNRLFIIIESYKDTLNEINEYIFWKNNYLNSSFSSDIPVDYQDLLIYSSEENRNQSDEFRNHMSKIPNLYFKIYSILEILKDNNNKENNIIFLLWFFVYEKIDIFKTINLKKEFLERNIINMNIDDKLYNIFTDSFLFKNKKIETLDINRIDMFKLYQLILTKPKLFLEYNSIPYNELFNYISKQNTIKLDLIQKFLQNKYRKEYSEKDLIFIFENDLEDFEITKVENIPKLLELKNKWINISEFLNCSIAIFNEVYNLYLNDNIKSDAFIILINDEEKIYNIQYYIEYIEEMKNNLTFLSINDPQYELFKKESEIDFNDFSKRTINKENISISKWLYNEFEDKKKKILNLLNKENLDELKEDYYFLIEKIDKIKSKTKDKKLQKKEKEQRNLFVKNFFNKNSIDDIKLIIEILQKVEISSNNTFETLEENINLIIQYKTFAREKINDINPKFLKELSEYLNKKSQAEFYKIELEKQKIDIEYIEEILSIYSEDSELKNILHILENIEENDDFILLITENKISNTKLNIVNNLLSLFNASNIDYNFQIEIIENILENKDFNYNKYKDKINFIRQKTLLFKIENWNSDIKTLIINYLNDKINNFDIEKQLKTFNKIEVNLNNDFDKKIFEVLEEDNENESKFLSEKIDHFLNNIIQDFNPSTSHSTDIHFNKWNWNYTNLIRRKIFRKLKKLNHESNLEHLNRIKILNFNNFFVWADNLWWDMENIISSSKNISLWFYEALENFWINTISNIVLKWNKFLTLSEYYSKVFEKHKKILEL